MVQRQLQPQTKKAGRAASAGKKAKAKVSRTKAQKDASKVFFKAMSA